MENTIVESTKDLPIEDHLHIRGEHHGDNIDLGNHLGSPPHTWRTL